MARNRYFEDEQLTEKFNGKMIFRILSYVKPYRKKFIGAFTMMILMGFVVLIPPYLNRFMVDYLFDPINRIDNHVAWLVVAISALAFIGVADVTYNFFRYRLLTHTAYYMVHDVRRALFMHLQTLSFDYFDSRPAGKILVRATSYIDEMANIFSGTILSFLVDVIKMLLVLVWLYVLDWRFAGIITLAVVPMGIMLTVIRSILHKRFRAHRNKSSNRTAYIAENIQGTQVTKLFNRIKTNVDIYDDLCSQTNRTWRRAIFVNELMWPSMDFFWNIGMLAIYTVATVLILNYGDTTISDGKLISFVSYLAMFNAPLMNLAVYIQQISVASSNLERIFETMDTPASVHDRPDATDLPDIEGHVTFDNVTFGYDKGINILEHLTLDVPAGKTIALVGPTGGGKSTVVSLINRFYDIQEGVVSIDGNDIAKVKLHSLRAQIGVMMQDSFLFSGTVLDNIRYGRPDATDEECIDAAVKARCDGFIMQMQDGYHHVIAEKGAGLSSGQIQLLSFARTILRDPKILILDEATSSIDTETETLVQATLSELLVGRTSFVIAHRLSTIRKADCILYIADKGIQEAGTHDELMAKRGLYYQLASTQ